MNESHSNLHSHPVPQPNARFDGSPLLMCFASFSSLAYGWIKLQKQPGSDMVNWKTSQGNYCGLRNQYGLLIRFPVMVRLAKVPTLSFVHHVRSSKDRVHGAGQSKVWGAQSITTCFGKFSLKEKFKQPLIHFNSYFSESRGISNEFLKLKWSRALKSIHTLKGSL